VVLGCSNMQTVKGRIPTVQLPFHAKGPHLDLQGVRIWASMAPQCNGSTWQFEMGWPDIHWLARDKGGLAAAIMILAYLPVCQA
jgi:hypothetical protein